MSLSITVSEGGGGNWENAPTGIHKSTCCDVVDLGRQETEFGEKHQCELHFELKVSQKTGSEYTSITTASPKNKNEVFPPLSGAYTRRVIEAAPVAAPAATPAPAAPVQPAPAPAVNLTEDDVPF